MNFIEDVEENQTGTEMMQDNFLKATLKSPLHVLAESHHKQKKHECELPMEASATAADATQEMVVIDIEDDDLELATAGSSQDSTILQHIKPETIASQENLTQPSDEDSSSQIGHLQRVEMYQSIYTDENDRDERAQVDVKDIPQQLLKYDTEALNGELQVISQNSERKQHPRAQCRRLYGCIQAAASKVEDSTKDRSIQRVTRLTRLIERHPDHLGELR